MIGNAVPVKLAKYVGCAILDYIQNPNRYKHQELDLFDI